MARPRLSEYEDTRQQSRNNYLRKAYKITQAVWDALYDQQDGRCAICGRDDRDLVVDHNHGDGTIRGLLCSNCNTGIGLLGDDPDVLDAAAEYLHSRGFFPDQN